MEPNMETLRALEANIKYAIRNHEQVSIGGGIFNYYDLESLLCAVQKMIQLLEVDKHNGG